MRLKEAGFGYRRFDVSEIATQIYEQEMPRGWQTQLAQASVTTTSPNRKHTIKIDSAGLIDVDHIIGSGRTLEVRTERQAATSKADLAVRINAVFNEMRGIYGIN